MTFELRDCPDSNAAPPAPEVLAFAELGLLSRLNRTQHPDFPPLNLVDRDVDFSTLFKSECTQLDMGRPESMPYFLVWVVYTVVLWVSITAFLARRHLQPIRSRNVKLIVGTQIVNWLVWSIILHPLICTLSRSSFYSLVLT